MPLRIIFREISDDEDALRFYLSSSPLNTSNLPAPVEVTGPSGTLTDDSSDYGANAFSHVVPWDESQEAYVRVAAVKDGVETVSAEWHFFGIGQEVGGGIYAGMMRINNTPYHIIAGKAASEEYGLPWKTSRTSTPDTRSDTDGLANTLAMEAAGIADHPAGAHCLAYTGGGHSDWYMPARLELLLVYNNLAGHPEFAGNVGSGDDTLSSTASGTLSMSMGRNFSTGNQNTIFKNSTSERVRPIRRIPVLG